METLDQTDVEAAGTQDFGVPIKPTTGNDASLDTIISSAIDKVEAAEPPAKADVETKTNSAGRVIGADGKFVSTKPAEAKPSEASEPVDATAKAAVDPNKPVEAKPAEEQPLEPHARWTPEEKAIFAALPRDAQQWALNREKDAEGVVTRKTQELAEQRKSAEPLLNEVSRWSQYLQSRNIQPHEAVGHLFAAEHTLATGTPQQKHALIAKLVSDYRVDFPIHSGDATGEQPAVDPQIHELRTQNLQLQQRVDALARNAQQVEYQRAESELNALATVKDETGNPKYPHFERVKGSMIQLAASGQAETWDTAYAKSVRLDDDLHKQVVESERQKALADAEKARLEAVKKAENAKPVVASNALLNGKASLKGLDAHITSALDRAGM